MIVDFLKAADELFTRRLFPVALGLNAAASLYGGLTGTPITPIIGIIDAVACGVFAVRLWNGRQNSPTPKP